MTTILDGALRREIIAEKHPYTVTLTPIGLKLVRKGKRNGIELTWASLVNGEAALAAGLNATLQRLHGPKSQVDNETERPRRVAKRNAAARDASKSH
ncbi:MAG: hypothetical protein ABI881_04640 [Betaproteobacteria bacterium]